MKLSLPVPRRDEYVAGGGGSLVYSGRPSFKRTSSSASVKPRELLDDYTIGEVLGEGAFGIVYACTRRGTDNDFAVKMVDKVESPIDDIKREVDLLNSLAHPNIVRFVEVFFEKCFVCIVLDRYHGGDLFMAMQLYWDSRGRIPCEQVSHVTKQILNAVAFLHEEKVVHRDIKGDNYLMDRTDILDPQCHVTLTDFGTACRQQDVGERFTVTLGTRTYWAPEVFARDYSAKVDVWAVGIVFTALLTGQFPFASERAIADPTVKPAMAVGLPPQCLDLIGKLLDKREESRPTAAEALQHSWIAQRPTPAVDVSVGMKAGLTSPIDMRESAPTVCVHQRRLELVERLEDTARARSMSSFKSPVTEFLKPSFVTADKPAEKEYVFEWWPVDKVDELVGVHLQNPATPSMAAHSKRDIPPPTVCDALYVQVVGQMLEEHGIDTGLFGQNEAKSLETFASEVHRGTTRLMLDATQHKSLVRVVDVVLLRLSYESEEQQTRYLVEYAERFPDGRIRKDLNRLPGSKKNPHENTRMVAERIIDKTLNMRDCDVKLNLLDTEVFEDDEESPSYPGVRTVYRMEIVEGWVLSENLGILQRIGAVESMSIRATTSLKERPMSRQSSCHTPREGSTANLPRRRQRRQTWHSQDLQHAVETVRAEVDGSRSVSPAASESSKRRGRRISSPGRFGLTLSVPVPGRDVGHQEGVDVSLPGVEFQFCHKDPNGNTKFFAWLTDEQCETYSVGLKEPESVSGMDALVNPPIGFSEEALREFLVAKSVDPETVAGTGTLKDLADESLCGESTIVTEMDGRVLRIVDLVLLRLVAGSQALVQTRETILGTEPRVSKSTNLLPGSKKRPDENQFVTARRVLEKQLRIDTNLVNLNPDTVDIVEERKVSQSFPGMETLYRKRIITGEVQRDAVDLTPSGSPPVEPGSMATVPAEAAGSAGAAARPFTG